MANPILVTGAAGRVGAIGRAVTELLLKHGKAVRAMVRTEDERAQALRDMGAEVVVSPRSRFAAQADRPATDCGVASRLSSNRSDLRYVV